MNRLNKKRVIIWLTGNTPAQSGIIDQMFGVLRTEIERDMFFNEVFQIMFYPIKAEEYSVPIDNLNINGCALVHVWFENVVPDFKHFIWVHTPWHKNIKPCHSQKMFYITIDEKTTLKLRMLGVPQWRIWHLPFNKVASERVIIERVIGIYSYLLTLCERGVL